MGANYHGYFTYRCYDDCRQEGCPSHRARLVSKHGGYYVDVLDEQGKPTERIDIGEIGLINAVADVLAPRLTDPESLAPIKLITAAEARQPYVPETPDAGTLPTREK